MFLSMMYDISSEHVQAKYTEILRTLGQKDVVASSTTYKCNSSSRQVPILLENTSREQVQKQKY